MSIEIAAVLISVGGGIIGGLIALGGQFLLFSKQSSFQKSISNLESTDKFKLVALEKRLEKHQEAFSHWIDLVRVIHQKYEVRDLPINQSRDFWKNNCLYLDKDSSKAFEICITFVDLYPVYLENYKQKPLEERKKDTELVSIWNQIMDTGKIIAQGIGLPHLKAEDVADYDKEGNKLDKKLKFKIVRFE